MKRVGNFVIKIVMVTGLVVWDVVEKAKKKK